MAEGGNYDVAKTDKEVEDFLKRIDLQELSSIFKKNKVTMKMLLKMDKGSLIEIGVAAYGDRYNILEEIERMNKTHEETSIEKLRDDSLNKVSDFLNFIPCNEEASIETSGEDSLNKVSDFEGFIPCSTNNHQEVRVVLLGKTGVGKSKTANSLVGENSFESKLASRSVTKKCKAKKVNRFGRSLVVVDTPGLCDTSVSDEKTIKEISRCVGVTAPGPHVFLLVLNLAARFTAEEKNATDRLLNIFGKNMHPYVVIVFTRKDIMASEISDMEDYINNSDQHLQSLIEKCGRRYVAFNNIAQKIENDRQVLTLLNMIDENSQKLDSSHYTSTLLSEAEKLMLKKERVIIENREKQKREDIKSKQTKISQQCSDQRDPLIKRYKTIQVKIWKKEDKLTKISNLQRENALQKINNLKLELKGIRSEIDIICEKKKDSIRYAVDKIEKQYNNMENARDTARKEIQQDGSAFELFVQALRLLVLSLLNSDKIVTLQLNNSLTTIIE